jgi:hypothetical protein
MIHRLRRRHRYLIAGLFVFLVLAVGWALTHPAPDPVMERLPEFSRRR